MHFDFSMSLGQLAIVVTLLGGFFKFYTPIAERFWQHDIMWERFAEDNNISANDHPRRKLWENGQ
jgi:hypothetical protein